MVRRPKTLIDRLRRLADAACAHPPRAMSTGADVEEWPPWSRIAL